MTRTVITYGSFDLFHFGHLNMLRRLRELGDRLVVGVSTDEFNAIKGKRTVIPFQHRIQIVSAIKYVDEAFPEDNWDQKVSDVKKYQVAIFGIGNDWVGKFDFLKPHCDVHYLDRTGDISSSGLKQALSPLYGSKLAELKNALDIASAVLRDFEV